MDIGCRDGGQRVEVDLFAVYLFDDLFQIADLDAAVADLDLFAEQIGAAVGAVVVEIDKITVIGILDVQNPGEVVGHPIAHQRAVGIVGQQDPCLGGLVAALFQQVGIFLQLELIGLLGIAPGGVAAALDLLHSALIDQAAVAVEQDQGVVLGLVALGGVDIGVILGRIGAGDVEGAQIGRLHDADRSRGAVHGDADPIAAVGRTGGEEGEKIKGLARLDRQASAACRDFAARGREIQRQGVQVGRSGQKQAALPIHRLHSGAGRMLGVLCGAVDEQGLLCRRRNGHDRKRKEGQEQESCQQQGKKTQFFLHGKNPSFCLVIQNGLEKQKALPCGQSFWSW